MRAETFSVILRRELAALHRAVEAYPSDAALWASPPGVPNAGGTLALHLVGNLRHFVGATLGGSGFVRDRDAEFTRRDVSREAVLAEIDEALGDVERALATAGDAALDRPYPLAVGTGKWTIPGAEWLVHLVAHTAYHLGQLDYHRRMVTGELRGVDAIAVRELPSARS